MATTSTPGACLCGGIRFRIDGPLAPIDVCHCGQCRRAQGTPFATNIPIEDAAFTLLEGGELLQAYESTPGKRRVFCRRCGSPLWSERDALPGRRRIRAGTLDGPLATRPGAHFHVDSACDWWTIEADGLPRQP